MSLHYLIDPFTTNGDIVDVVTADSGQTNCTGSAVVRVPDGVAIHTAPTNRTDLATAKYAGTLAYYAGFTNILADPCWDPSGVDLTFPFTTGLNVSSAYVNHSISTFMGLCCSTLYSLAPAPNPTQCVVTWEEYSFTDTDDKTDRFQRTYVEGTGSDLTCWVSFNDLASKNLVYNGAVFNIPVADQGTDFRVVFGNMSGHRIYLGSWSLIY